MQFTDSNESNAWDQGRRRYRAFVPWSPLLDELILKFIDSTPDNRSLRKRQSLRKVLIRE
jgi:hypothetical protein